MALALTMSVGQVQLLTASELWSDDSLRPSLINPLTWTSSDSTKVILWGANSPQTQIKATALHTGSATITCTDGSTSPTVVVTVVAASTLTDSGLQIVMDLPHGATS